MGIAALILPALSRAADPSTQPVAADTQPVEHARFIRQWFADLANADPAIRADAMTHLMGLASSDLITLKNVVREYGPIEPAQATVLRTIVTQAFLAGEDYHGKPDVGFLGVRMDTTGTGFHDVTTGATTKAKPGVVIVERMPGFAGARMLRDGDVILALRDRPDTPLGDTNQFSDAIRQFKPGTIVHFQVLRQGEITDVPIKLDSRPLEADPGFGMDEFIEARQRRADEYWSSDFAPLVKESVS
jgi:hypothetical protein